MRERRALDGAYTNFEYCQEHHLGEVAPARSVGGATKVLMSGKGKSSVSSGNTSVYQVRNEFCESSNVTIIGHDNRHNNYHIEKMKK